MTGAPENQAWYGGIWVPCSQCDHSRSPAFRYNASSPNAVLARTMLTESAVWTASTASSGHGIRSRVIRTPRRLGAFYHHLGPFWTSFQAILTYPEGSLTADAGAANARSPVSRSRAARRTSALTSSYSWVGVAATSRYLRRLSAWTRHSPSSALAAICGSGSAAVIPARAARTSAAPAAAWSITSAW